MLNLRFLMWCKDELQLDESQCGDDIAGNNMEGKAAFRFDLVKENHFCIFTFVVI